MRIRGEKAPICLSLGAQGTQRQADSSPRQCGHGRPAMLFAAYTGTNRRRRRAGGQTNGHRMATHTESIPAHRHRGGCAPRPPRRRPRKRAIPLPVVRPPCPIQQRQQSARFRYGHRAPAHAHRVTDARIPLLTPQPERTFQAYEERPDLETMRSLPIRPGCRPAHRSPCTADVPTQRSQCSA